MYLNLFIVDKPVTILFSLLFWDQTSSIHMLSQINHPDFQISSFLIYWIIFTFLWMTLSSVKSCLFNNLDMHVPQSCRCKWICFWAFFVKKHLLVGTSGLCYERVNGWVSGWVSKWEMYVFHTNQIGSSINSQSNIISYLCYMFM